MDNKVQQENYKSIFKKYKQLLLQITEKKTKQSISHKHKYQSQKLEQIVKQFINSGKLGGKIVEIDLESYQQALVNPNMFLQDKMFLFGSKLSKIILNKEKLMKYIWWNNMLLKQEVFLLVFEAVEKQEEAHQYIEQFDQLVSKYQKRNSRRFSFKQVQQIQKRPENPNIARIKKQQTDASPTAQSDNDDLDIQDLETNEVLINKNYDYNLNLSEIQEESLNFGHSPSKHKHSMFKDNEVNTLINSFKIQSFFQDGEENFSQSSDMDLVQKIPIFEYKHNQNYNYNNNNKEQKLRKTY